MNINIYINLDLLYIYTYIYIYNIYNKFIYIFIFIYIYIYIYIYISETAMNTKIFQQKNIFKNIIFTITNPDMLQVGSYLCRRRFRLSSMKI